MIFIHRTQEPDILANKGKDEQGILCKAYEQGARKFDFKSSIYAHETVKQALITMQHDKCCFCESKFTHISYGDVEHYRPKGAYKQDNSESLQPLGYYWLAYAWDNLLLSCTLCNQQYKKNLFPLLDSDKRARNHHDDISEEQPLLINPSLVNPQEHIGFRDEIPYAVDSSVYGQATIDTLGLGRESLNEIRRTKLNTIAHLFKVLTAANNQSNEEWQEIAKQTKLLLEKSADATAEYSAMVSAYYSQQETTINLIST
jgi:hypothetical protein